jgi:hypothetical protein
LSILAAAIKMMEDKLAKELFIKMQPGLNSDFRATIAGKLFKIIEDIHKTRREDADDYKQTTSLSHKIANQFYNTNGAELPQTLKILINTRNKAVHKQHLEADEFLDFLNKLAGYLKEIPNSPSGIRHASADDKTDNLIILKDCVSEINKISKKEISVSRPNKMKEGIFCRIIIQKSFIGAQDQYTIRKGCMLKYNLKLEKKNGNWVAYPSNVEVLNNGVP